MERIVIRAMQEAVSLTTAIVAGMATVGGILLWGMLVLPALQEVFVAEDIRLAARVLITFCTVALLVVGSFVMVKVSFDASHGAQDWLERALEAKPVEEPTE